MYILKSKKIISKAYKVCLTPSNNQHNLIMLKNTLNCLEKLLVILNKKLWLNYYLYVDLTSLN